MWAGQSGRELTTIIRAGRWDALPPALAKLLPHVADITITKFTRAADAWQGAYARLTGRYARLAPPRASALSQPPLHAKTPATARGRRPPLAAPSPLLAHQVHGPHHAVEIPARRADLHRDDVERPWG